MTLSQVVSRLRRHKPTSELALLKVCKFPLRFIGNGVFRDVYEILDTGYVLKMPNGQSSVEHAVNEYRAWRQIKRSRRVKFKSIKPHLPEILYFSEHSGLTLMPKYEEPEWGTYEKEMDRLETAVREAFGAEEADLGSEKWDNFGVDKDGNLRIIDLGVLEV